MNILKEGSKKFLVFQIQRRIWDGNKVFFSKKEGFEKKDGWKKEIKLPIMYG